MPERALRIRPLAPPLAGLLLLCAVASCTDDLPPFCPPYHVGAVEGYVREAGVGVAAEVRAVAQEGVRRGDIVAVTTADSTGWYRLELPTELYRLDTRLPGVSTSYIRSDTVRVAQRVHRFDLLRGRAEITIAVPAELAGRPHTLQLRGPRYNGPLLIVSPEDGAVRFTFRLQKPGSYAMILAAGESRDNECYLPGTIDSRAADSLIVGVDTVSRYTADFRALHASISGRVTGSWQEARTYAPEVEATPDSLSTLARTACRSDGSFTLDFLVPRVVRLRTNIAGVEQWIGGDSFASAREFALQPGDRITDVSLVESGIGISLEGPGDLINYWTTVVVRNEAGEEFPSYSTSDNPITVCNLRPGRYYVHLDGSCHHQIWEPQWYGGADRLEDATPVDLGVGELRQIVVDLVQGGRISGDLLTADGLRPSYSSVWLMNADDEPVCDYAMSISDGVFDFPGLVDGDYRLAVSEYPHDLWWWPGTYDPEAAATITVAGHAAVTGLRWLLPPAGQAARP